MNEKQLEQLMAKAAERGLDDLEVRLEVYLVFGGEKTRVVAFQVEPEMFPPTLAAMAAKMDESWASSAPNPEGPGRQGLDTVEPPAGK